MKLEELAAEEAALKVRMKQLRRERQVIHAAAESAESWWSSDEEDEGEEEDGYESEVEISKVGAWRESQRESGQERWFDAVGFTVSPVCVVGGVEIEMI